MRILVDSREKKWGNVQAWFEKQGIEYEVVALKTGDYMMEGTDTVTVDRKRNLQEVAQNLFDQHGRFMREVRRAYDRGIKLVLLIEQGGGIRKIDDVRNWKSKYGVVSGASLADRMFRVHIAYGTEFLFCDKRSTGRRIVEILEGYARDTQEDKG